MEQNHDCLNYEDYIVISPSEAGEEEYEYCAQDESRPKQFGMWGYIVPVGRAVTSLLSNYLDSRKDPTLSPASSNITVDTMVASRLDSEVCPDLANGHNTTGPDLENQEDASIHENTSGLIRRRKSMKKMNAVSSFGEKDTCYTLQRFKLLSRDNSTEDYLMLKVKTKHSHTGSFDSPTVYDTHSRNRQPDSVVCAVGLSHGQQQNLSNDDVEKDSPARIKSPTCRPEGSVKSESTVLRRQSGMASKSYSMPSRTDIVSPDSLVNFHWNECMDRTESSVESSASNEIETTPSEEDIKRIVTQHCTDFVNYSNWATLLPILETEQLLDPDTKDILMDPSRTKLTKSNHFYLKTLPSQGKRAYSTFYKCMLQEKEHHGHKTLQGYLRSLS